MSKRIIAIIALLSFVPVASCQAAGTTNKKTTTKQKHIITTSIKLGKLGNIKIKF